ncbi:uncharacterized protein TRAVEDRAFT_52095 [Trametes versicolor FP-101664 SS1]|uniref:uncharacterized protein n=1 Tax=Trametes versicolor (strain FP-101664) TaxID=717944 RepID=UPI00046216C5|nr:uncharacterized protein TRAVEDRAFT_52095 [Trametes versicolor FP-101664 SS1]EIW54390.1 hypothetical protein TRAVEDRAFT_52095 [Trametes versicolor FP-101664 SS1]
MVATFILTRTFAISALFVGAVLPFAIAAPLPSPEVVRSFSFDKRFCRQMSCLFEVPTDTTDGPSTEAADTDAQLTKMASDGTEAVFVAGGIEPEEGDVGDIPEPTESF